MISNPNRSARRLGLRAIVVSAVAAVAAFGVFASSASAGPVDLNWTQHKVYDSPYVVTNTCRTWLGYVVRSGPSAAFSNGSTTGSGGPTVNGDTPFGLCKEAVDNPDPTPDTPRELGNGLTWSFGAVSGSVAGSIFSPPALEGELQFSGTFSYNSPAPPAGHGFHIDINNPKIVLNGDGTGALFASGTGVSGTTPPAQGSVTYDYTNYNDLKIFDLDLDSARVKLNFDGSSSVIGIEPSLAAVGFFTNGYPVGSGPDRWPNTFGTFSIAIPAAAGPQGPAGSDGLQGIAGPQGPIGPAGAAGKDATVKTIKLKKASFGKKRVVAKITRKGKTYGYAEIKGKKAKLTYVGTLKGKYVLKSITGKSRKLTVKLG